VIYVDTSVVLAHLLAEDRRPVPEFWNEPLIASRLLDYEVRTRLNNLRIATAGREIADALIQRIALIELVPEVVHRARQKDPVQLRTLDALHIGSVEFLRGQGVALELATFDERMRAAAIKLKIPLYRL
jgi:predicted nucleic acid-binding protein